MNREEVLQAIEEKYEKLGIPVDAMFEGLLHSNPINYWDYIQTDALLGLQIMRTNCPDEMVFIMYHQVNELLFKMILWEIKQVAETKTITTEKFSKHLYRISRYFDMLSHSFDIMGDGMDLEQYLKFRHTLTPASGYQSAQYRTVELSSTEIDNLIAMPFKHQKFESLEEKYNHLYWQMAGKDFKTGERSRLLIDFEQRYKSTFLDHIKQYEHINLWSKFKSLPKAERENKALLNAMRHYDHTVNVKWVMAHYNAAGKYLGGGDVDIEATGGSDWRRYMHPKYQRRIFFPDLWSEDELKTWGEGNLDGYKLL